MNELLDLAHFDTMTGGDKALQAEVVDLFRGQATRWADAFDPETPTPGWRDAAHTLKGSARGVGLWALARACEQAEAAAGSAEAADALRNLRRALAEALAALDAVDRP